MKNVLKKEQEKKEEKITLSKNNCTELFYPEHKKCPKIWTRQIYGCHKIEPAPFLFYKLGIKLTINHIS